MTEDDMVLWRFKTDGGLDTDFNERGWVVDHNAADGNATDSGYAVTIDSEGEVFVAGISVGPGTYGDMVLWQVTPGGSVVRESMDERGWIVHQIAASGDFSDGAKAVAVDNSGRILVAGSSSRNSEDMVTWRLDSKGKLDTTFGGTGWVQSSTHV